MPPQTAAKTSLSASDTTIAETYGFDKKRGTSSDDQLYNSLVPTEQKAAQGDALVTLGKDCLYIGLGDQYITPHFMSGTSLSSAIEGCKQVQAFTQPFRHKLILRIDSSKAKALNKGMKKVQQFATEKPLEYDKKKTVSGPPLELSLISMI